MASGIGSSTWTHFDLYWSVIHIKTRFKCLSGQWAMQANCNISSLPNYPNCASWRLNVRHCEYSVNIIIRFISHLDDSFVNSSRFVLILLWHVAIDFDTSTAPKSHTISVILAWFGWRCLVPQWARLLRFMRQQRLNLLRAGLYQVKWMLFNRMSILIDVNTVWCIINRISMSR